MKIQVLKNSRSASFLIFLFILMGLTAHAQKNPPAPAPGLQITRTEVIKIVSAIDSSMIFHQERDIDDLPTFSAQSKNKTSVQLLGDEDELKFIKWAFSFTADAGINQVCVLNMSNFMFSLGDEKGGDWLNEQMAGIAKQTDKGFISKKIVLNNNRKAQLIYNPAGKIMSLIFTEW